MLLDRLVGFGIWGWLHPSPLLFKLGEALPVADSIRTPASVRKDAGGCHSGGRGRSGLELARPLPDRTAPRRDEAKKCERHGARAHLKAAISRREQAQRDMSVQGMSCGRRRSHRNHGSGGRTSATARTPPEVMYVQCWCKYKDVRGLLCCG